MPCISGNYTPAAGVLLQVAIIPKLPMQQNAPLPNAMMFNALLDTGASSTCISKKVVAQVGLQPIGKKVMSGATGQAPVDAYSFAVGFLLGAVQQPTGQTQGNLALHLVSGCEFENHGFGFDVLVGRDILCKGSFSLSFDGHFVFAF